MGVINSFIDWLADGTYTDDEREFAEKTDANSTRAMAYYAGYIAGKKEAQQVIQPDKQIACGSAQCYTDGKQPIAGCR